MNGTRRREPPGVSELINGMGLVKRGEVEQYVYTEGKWNEVGM